MTEEERISIFQMFVSHYHRMEEFRKEGKVQSFVLTLEASSDNLTFGSKIKTGTPLQKNSAKVIPFKKDN